MKNNTSVNACTWLVSFFILLARALIGLDEALASGLANTDLVLPAVVLGIDSTLAVIVDA